MTTLRFHSLRRTLLRAFPAFCLPLALAGCIGAPGADDAFDALAQTDFGPAQECLARAMYFESNRSSPDGMLAVGTVVMNRVESPSYPDDVCAVVAQRNQFAPGVMTREMNAGRELAMETAQRVLSGERHASVAEAKFFHTAGLNFPYRNMHYKVIAGGNAFYEKVSPRRNPDFKFASQADVKAAQRNAAGAIEVMRKAAYQPAGSSAPDAVASYASSAGDSVEAAAAKPEPLLDSPFLGLFGERKADKPASETSAKGGRVRSAHEGAREPANAETSDLAGVETGLRGSVGAETGKANES
ncbi:cell wall hydrolase [Jiella marina]|uniref:cell wall hydrolase n=1 Tax=Jiella sp. LLJ827 TaxID=2917712 RepID=UPI002101B146|nr:cell wall hydrolase [Jiella sp. LLJ827]MCQ0988408.1 cell wall hydrolase [Jiella sp. LLJ827]